MGRRVAEGTKAGGERVGGARALRPWQCRELMRRRLAREFDGILDGFIAAAKKGSCPHVRLVTELLETERKPQGKKKGSAALLLEKLEKEERARAENGGLPHQESPFSV